MKRYCPLGKPRNGRQSGHGLLDRAGESTVRTMEWIIAAIGDAKPCSPPIFKMEHFTIHHRKKEEANDHRVENELPNGSPSSLIKASVRKESAKVFLGLIFTQILIVKDACMFS